MKDKVAVRVMATHTRESRRTPSEDMRHCVTPMGREREYAAGGWFGHGGTWRRRAVVCAIADGAHRTGGLRSASYFIRRSLL